MRYLKHQVAFVYTLFLLSVLLLSVTLNAAQPLPIDHPPLRITPEQPSPVILHVGAVDQNILALEIEAQRTQRSAVQTYKPLPGDRTKVKKQDGIVKSVELIRRGKPVAYLAGKDRRHVWFFEKLIGDPFDTNKADDPATYVLSLTGGSRTYSPKAVYRKSKPVDIVNPAREFPKRHYVYFELPFHLNKGQSYTLRMPDLRLNKKEITFSFNPLTTRSEAIHVNHIGFRPGDKVKHAYLSIWLGNGGSHTYNPNLRFTLLDHKTGTPVFTGKLSKTWPANRPENMKRKQNHSLTDVSLIDFSSFSKPGTYRIYVENTGCSYPFSIGQTIWKKPLLTAMKGFYHQRSGIPLGAPYSTFSRPRPYHPDDGLKVYVSAVTLMETRNGLNLLRQSNNFEALNKHVTDQIVHNAWGGYFDAADWDRRIQHLAASRCHLELMELFPEYFADLDLNIPESGDTVPDILDEALFNIDFYRRLQTSEGGIRGGIEAAEHPVRGETSWLDSLKVMAYEPGPWSSYIYANVAARAAYVLRPFAAERANILEKSALRAWSWAQANVDRFEKKYGKSYQWKKVIDERNLAAIEFYRLTGDQRWHDLFIKDSVLKSSNLNASRQHHAAFLYARLPDSLGELRLKKAAEKILLENADTALAFAKENAWSLASSNPPGAVGTSWFSTPDLVPLMRAHYLTGKPVFYAGIVKGVSFSLGANPMNITYTTGVGHQWPRNAMVLDSRRTARAVPHGITVFGQVDYNYARMRKNSWHLGALDWFLVRKKVIYPDPFTWPVNESYWDIHQWPSACEFTPQSTMGSTSYMWGYLAAQSTKL
ncbi:MAG: hypothetical protein GY845_11640 [Planctomycetes bacterium]|nr:hypothetical protein [Planctomycetota bacterium]